MKRTNDLAKRTELSEKRKKLRETLDSLGPALERARNRPCFTSEQRSEAQAEVSRLESVREQLKEGLLKLSRGSRAQIAAGWQ